MELRDQLSGLKNQEIESRRRNLGKSVSVLILKAVLDEMVGEAKTIQSDMKDRTSIVLELEVRNRAMQAEFSRKFEAQYQDSVKSQEILQQNY